MKKTSLLFLTLTLFFLAKPFQISTAIDTGTDKNPIPVSPKSWDFGEVANIDAQFLTPQARAQGLLPRVNAVGAARGVNIVGRDRQILYFSSNRGGPTVGWDIFASATDSEGQWSVATNNGSVKTLLKDKSERYEANVEGLNTKYDERAPSLTPDGKTVFFSSNRLGGSGRLDIYTSTLEDGKWKKPVNLGPRINSSGDDEMPTCTPDGKTLYWASARKGSIGGFDIWMSTLKNDRWSDPVNAGPGVNSEFDDTAPNPTADGETIFFSSYRPGGLGSKDIWYSVKVKGRWAKAINPGAPVNSPALDGCPNPSLDMSQLYFASGREGGYGAQDVYVVPIKKTQ